MSKKHPSIIHVHPKFKALLKVECALNGGKSMYDFTEELASQEELVSEYIKNKPKGMRRKNGFGFKF